jgi:ABC-type amino acid transport substrate-binding protein
MANNAPYGAYRRCMLILLLTILLFGMPSTQTVSAKTLRCALVQIEPFGFLAEDGQITGIHYDAMKRIVEATGHSFKPELAPFARVIQHLRSGYADLAVMYRNAKIDEAAVLVGPFMRDARNVVFGRSGVTCSSLEDLHGKQVAHLLGAHYDDALAADEAIKKYYTTSYQHSLRMFLKNRVDAIVGPEDGILFAAKKRGMALDLFGAPLVLNTREAFMFFSKRTVDHETLTLLRSTLDRLRKAGVIDEIRAKYVDLSSPSELLPEANKKRNIVSGRVGGYRQ